VRKLHSGDAEMASQKVYKKDHLKTKLRKSTMAFRLKHNYSEDVFSPCLTRRKDGLCDWSEEERLPLTSSEDEQS